MEIERKFTVKTLPVNLSSYPCRIIEQAYLNTDPVVRIRRSRGRNASAVSLSGNSTSAMIRGAKGGSKISSSTHRLSWSIIFFADDIYVGSNCGQSIGMTYRFLEMIFPSAFSRR